MILQIGRRPIGPALATILMLLAGACGDDSGTAPAGNGAGKPIHLPLAVGNRWSYAVTRLEGQDADTTTQVDRLTGTRSYSGETYFVMSSDQTWGSSETTLVRQSGQALLAVPGFAGQLEDSSAVGSFLRILAASLPWTLADFGAPPGRIDSFQADTTVSGYGDFTLSLEIWSQGRGSIQVPAGTFEDVYLGKSVLTVTGREGGIPFLSRTITTELAIADSVGVVRQKSEERLLATGNPEEVVSETALLRSYGLIW